MLKYMTILALLPILLVQAPSNDIQVPNLTIESNRELLEYPHSIIVFTIGNSSIEFTEINASDILEKIENGEDVDLKNTRIIGELDVSKIKLKTVNEEWRIWQKVFVKELKVVESNITIVNSIFENDVDFSNTLFRGTFHFSNTSFLGRSNFVTTKFIEDADFSRANFTGDVIFSSAKFCSFAIFSSANFNGRASFVNAHFNSAADFGGTSFGNGAEFPWAIFDEVAYFNRASFSNAAYFDYAIFDEDAHFDKAKFESAAHFNDTNFDDVYFTDAEFLSVTLVNTDFQSVRVKWSSLKNALVFDGPMYIKLIKNFREIEQFGDANDAYYEYREQKRKNELKSIRLFSWDSIEKFLWDNLLWFICGYGVRPLRALFVGLIIILIFSCTSYKRNDNSFLNGNEIKSDKYREFVRIINKTKSNFLFRRFIQGINKIVPTGCPKNNFLRHLEVLRVSNTRS